MIDFRSDDLTPPPAPTGDRADNGLPRAEGAPASDGRRSVWTVGGGLKADVRDLSQGIPIVFLHGLVGLNEHWEDVVGRVEHAARPILFELPLLRLRGEHCSIHGVTALTIRFLEEYLDGEPAVLAGNSFGGHVATRIAIDRPDLVRGLVLAGSSGVLEKSMVSDVQRRPTREWLSRKIGELFYDQSLMRNEDLDRAHAELSDRGGARAMVRLSRTARRDLLHDVLDRISCPTLLIWGEKDIVTPPEAARVFEQQIPASRLVWIPECGHAPMLEAPGVFAEELLRFLGELGESESESAPAVARATNADA